VAAPGAEVVEVALVSPAGADGDGGFQELANFRIEAMEERLEKALSWIATMKDMS